MDLPPRVLVVCSGSKTPPVVPGDLLSLPPLAICDRTRVVIPVLKVAKAKLSGRQRIGKRSLRGDSIQQIRKGEYTFTEVKGDYNHKMNRVVLTYRSATS
jgi:hypothetical protein